MYNTHDIINQGFGTDFGTPCAALVNFLTTENNRIENINIDDMQLYNILYRNMIPSNATVDEIVVARNLFWTTDKVLRDAIDKVLVDAHYVENLLTMCAGGTQKFLRNAPRMSSVRSTPVKIGDKILDSAADDIAQRLTALLEDYNNLDGIKTEDIAKFHIAFENLHPFTDFNGRIGRLLMAYQSVKAGMLPAGILFEDRELYYTVFDSENGVDILCDLIERFQDNTKMYYE